MSNTKIKEMGQTSQPWSWIAKCSETDHSIAMPSRSLLILESNLWFLNIDDWYENKSNFQAGLFIFVNDLEF